MTGNEICQATALAADEEIDGPDSGDLPVTDNGDVPVADDGDLPVADNGKDARRAELIATAQAGWIAALTDLGGRNTLLYFKDRRAGTLDLAGADPVALDRFIRSGSIRLTQLFRDVDPRR